MILIFFFWFDSFRFPNGTPVGQTEARQGKRALLNAATSLIIIIDGSNDENYRCAKLFSIS